MSPIGCDSQPRCGEIERRGALRAQQALNGIDYVEVGTPETSLCVHLFGPVPEDLTIANVRIRGGRRITGIRVLDVSVDRNREMHDDECLRVTLDRVGDHSPYCLCIVSADSPEDPAEWHPPASFDPRYACAEFHFRLDCSQTLDCKTDEHCLPTPQPPQEINYLAKDYASFRKLILDRMALKSPGWSERHAADLGITIAELLAYTADYLSYYQDAVATEAYLGTARRRISVRRHARLVDYRLHEGCNARAFMTIGTDTDIELPAAHLRFVVPPPGTIDPKPGLISRQELDAARANGAAIYQALGLDDATAIQLYAAHNEIHIYTWGDEACCLPRGSTRATLVDAARSLRLTVGDLLIFEEVIGPATGNPSDADPRHRHAVRLTSVEQTVDRLLSVTLLEIAWDPCDALPFDLCLSTRQPAPACGWVHDVSVARGNVVPVDHGDDAPEEQWTVPGTGERSCCSCEGAVLDIVGTPGVFAQTLAARPLTFAEPLPAGEPACRLFQRDPRLALPQLIAYGGPPDQVTADRTPAAGWRWQARYDLLESAPDARHFVVEIDDERSVHLRFGDGVLGARPQAGDFFRAQPRVGNGTAGNVGRDSIVWLALATGSLSGVTLTPRNPLPATGGVEPEPIADAKLYAPGNFRARALRAITTADYAKFAEANAGVQGAACAFEWTGIGYEANVAVDPLGSEMLSKDLAKVVACSLYPYRRIGHDIAVSGARYVPLSIELDVCVLPDFLIGHVESALRDRLGGGLRRDGQPAFFHPDRLALGAPLYLSALIAEAQAVTGVAHVRVSKLERLDVGERTSALDDGVLEIGPREIAQLDNDPDFPDRGILTFTFGGGR